MLKLRLLTAACIMAVAPVAASAAENVNLVWTHYTGWEPWGWIQDHGVAQDEIVRECGAGSKIKITLMNDYAESLNRYAAGSVDGVAATNMDALAVPGVGGVQTDMIAVTDYSNGNDAIITGDPSVKSVADLRGKQVNLVALTVSHYLLDRALEEKGIAEKSLRVVNTSDADIGAFFSANSGKANVVTWNPIVMSILGSNPKARVLYTSKQVPGEIIDAMVVRTSLASCAKTAIRNSWFSTIAKLHGHDAAMVAGLAKQAGGSVEDFNAQVLTTHFFWTPAEADVFVKSQKLKGTMDYVRKFSFDHGLYNGKAVDAVGISFPDGFVLGDKGNTMIEFVAQK
jgi:NitT/TauT family transport system substrate-binding protein